MNIIIVNKLIKSKNNIISIRYSFKHSINDLRLSRRNAAIDAGAVLPNINDGYRGAAPDLGAYELGAQLPHYGPRPVK